MKRLVVLAFLVLLPGLALAEDARQLRLEAGVLVQAAEAADTAQKRKKLLEDARSKLLEIQDRYPSESTRLALYLGGERVNLTLEDLETWIGTARRADLDVGKLREVLGRLPSATTVDENGWTDLHWAAVLNLPELADALIDAGADLGARLKDDREPLSDSLRRLLDEFGVSHDYSKNGSTPLHGAASENASEVAALLIGHGADVNPKDVYGDTPLHIAVRENASGVAALLIEHGADVRAKK